MLQTKTLNCKIDVRTRELIMAEAGSRIEIEARFRAKMKIKIECRREPKGNTLDPCLGCAVPGQEFAIPCFVIGIAFREIDHANQRLHVEEMRG